MAKEIYLLWDLKLGAVEGATTDRNKAEEMADKLNEILGGGMKRYKVITMKDFADK